MIRVLSLPLEEEPSSTKRVTWGKNARRDDTPRRLRLLALARIPQGRAWLGPCGARNDLYSPPPWLGRLNEKHIILDYLLDLLVVLRSLDNLLRKMIGRRDPVRLAPGTVGSSTCTHFTIPPTPFARHEFGSCWCLNFMRCMMRTKTYQHLDHSNKTPLS